MTVIRRTARLLAGACLLFTILSGCDGEAGSASTSSAGQGARLDLDTVVMTVGDSPVYWPEFKFWLKHVTNYYKTIYDLDAISDWDLEQDGVSLEEYFLAEAAQQAVTARAIEAEAARRGIELSDSDLAQIAEEREKNISIYGSESEYLRIIAGMYYTEQVYVYLQKVDRFTLELFKQLYGENGQKCTDEQVNTYVQQMDLMCAKYIFLAGAALDGTKLTAEQQADNRRELEGLISRLNLSADPLALFDSFVDEYNEDNTLLAYPDGRLFAPGVMGEEFESACAALGEGEYSGVVETDAGLYLILRIPIHPDMAADSSGSTLRYRTAYDYLFQNQIDEWCAEMDVDYSDAYALIEVKALFE